MTWFCPTVHSILSSCFYPSNCSPFSLSSFSSSVSSVFPSLPPYIPPISLPLPSPAPPPPLLLNIFPVFLHPPPDYSCCFTHIVFASLAILIYVPSIASFSPFSPSSSLSVCLYLSFFIPLPPLLSLPPPPVPPFSYPFATSGYTGLLFLLPLSLPLGIPQSGQG